MAFAPIVDYVRAPGAFVPLAWTDHRADPATWASALGVSTQACELLLDAHFVDLHNDLEVPVRLFGYDAARRHGPWSRTMPFFGHTDYPRLREAGLTGVCYDVATNPFRREPRRLQVTLANLEACRRRIGAFPEDFAVARSRADYDAIVASGRTAMFLCLQGGNALAADPSVLEGDVGRDLHRITLVHLSSSVLGGSNSPSQPDAGLTARGRVFVEACNAARVIVDLAHAGRQTFWDALDVHANDLPPIASHTGLCGVRPHWRNLDDAQVAAIADRGGVIGVVYQGNFLAPVPPGCAATRADLVAHLEHAVDVAGEDHVAIGTDYDGLITPPKDMTDVTHHPKLVQDLLDRGWTQERIRKVLGLNYLRVVADVRPGVTGRPPAPSGPPTG